MTEAVWLSIVALLTVMVTGILVPVVVEGVRGYRLRKDKAADRLEREQDREAAKAERAEVARLLSESDVRAIQTRQEIIGKVDEVRDISTVTHALVNSQYTEQKQLTLNLMRAQVLLLLDNVELHRAAGNEPSAERLAEIEAVRKGITVLEADIADRLMRAKAMAQNQK
jgi:hypothetical protein